MSMRSDLENKRRIKVAIDASRNRSGGAISHLIGIIQEGQPSLHGISEVHVWSYSKLLDQLPEKPWLVKHNPQLLEGSILKQIFWQLFLLPKEFSAADCDIILNTDAGTLSRIKPSVTMSRDMLSYEPREMERYGISFSRLRLIFLKYMQSSSLRRSDGAIFLTKYASKIIQKHCGKISNFALVPHGIADHFRTADRSYANSEKADQEFKLLYVSNTDLYKHQWHVIKAAETLFLKGYKIKLRLVGGGKGPAYNKLINQANESDPESRFVELVSFIPHKEISREHKSADIFIFASSCENMPNTLIEAMAAGMPIACSDRGPMPEVLEDAGLYFNPEDPDTIASAIEKLINDESLRSSLGERAEHLSKNYSWSKCSSETWEFLSKTYTLAS